MDRAVCTGCFSALFDELFDRAVSVCRRAVEQWSSSLKEDICGEDELGW
jgi:hypothetical protein